MQQIDFNSRFSIFKFIFVFFFSGHGGMVDASDLESDEECSWEFKSLCPQKISIEKKKVTLYKKVLPTTPILLSVVSAVDNNIIKIQYRRRQTGETPLKIKADKLKTAKPQFIYVHGPIYPYKKIENIWLLKHPFSMKK